MLAKDNEYLQETADSLYKANADEIIRQQCRAREEAERHERTMKRDIRLLKEENNNLKEQNTDLIEEISDLKSLIKELQDKLANTTNS